MSDHINLSRTGHSAPVADGERWILDVLLITVEENGQIVRSEAMDVEDTDAALARFAELDREINGHG
jgi:hypothetical protein